MSSGCASPPPPPQIDIPDLYQIYRRLRRAAPGPIDADADEDRARGWSPASDAEGGSGLDEDHDEDPEELVRGSSPTSGSHGGATLDADDDEDAEARVHSLSPAPPPSHYEVLEIDWRASAQEVRAAYKKAALRTHPDKPSGSTAAFQLVQEAFAVLSDTTSRARYHESVGLSV
jgi:hypothetical protein